MKKIVVLTLAIILSLALSVACTSDKAPKVSDTTSIAEQTELTSQSETATQSKAELPTTAQTVASSTSDIQSEQSQTQLQEPENCFDLKLYTDKAEYTTAEAITCWADLEYIGDNNSITIFHSDPYLTFSITDGKDFNSEGMAATILMNTTINKGEVIKTDYYKSGSWSADGPDAEFWENFYQQKELILPAGDYTITATLNYSLDEDEVVITKHIQKSEVKINVK